jgi:hypothetical protein
VTSGDRGEGVIEFIDALLASDLADLESRLIRRHLLLGLTADKKEVTISKRAIFRTGSGRP